MLLACIQWRGRSLGGGEHHRVVWVWMERDGSGTGGLLSLHTGKTNRCDHGGGSNFSDRNATGLLGRQKDVWTETLRQLLLLKP